MIMMTTIRPYSQEILNDNDAERMLIIMPWAMSF